MTQKLPVGKKSAVAAALAAAAAIATPFYVGWEGEELMPYKDIVGVWTVCSGDTRGVTAATPKQTPEQCAARTQDILKTYGGKVVKLSPGIENNPVELAAHTIFAANVGTGAYGKSSINRLYKAGGFMNRINACRAMRLYDKAGGRVIKGLQNRRSGVPSMLGEYELCIGGVIGEEYHDAL